MGNLSNKESGAVTNRFLEVRIQTYNCCLHFMLLECMLCCSQSPYQYIFNIHIKLFFVCLLFIYVERMSCLDIVQILFKAVLFSLNRKDVCMTKTKETEENLDAYCVQIVVQITCTALLHQCYNQITLVYVVYL